MPDLFGNPITDPGPTPGQRRPRRRADLAHPAPPGSGPIGAICQYCTHYTRRKYGSRAYLKCSLTRATWSHGSATDIHARDAACSLFLTAGEPPLSYRLEYTYNGGLDWYHGATFHQGHPYRDGQPIDDDTMRAEALSYLRTGTRRGVRIVRSDGVLICSHTRN